MLLLRSLWIGLMILIAFVALYVAVCIGNSTTLCVTSAVFVEGGCCGSLLPKE